MTIIALFKNDYENNDKLRLINTDIYEIYNNYDILSAHKKKIVFNSIDNLICHKNYNDIIYLKLSLCELFELPKLPNELYELDCNHNNLYTLPTLPYNLRRLLCSYNNLYRLPDHFPPYITYIKCINNNLFQINQFPNKLKFFHASMNNISYLPKIPDTLQVLELIDFNNTNILGCPILKKINKIFGYPYISRYIEGQNRYEYDNNYDDDDDMLQYNTCINWCKAYELYLKRNVKKIENWYMECKYNPIYKKCRDRLESEYDEIFNDLTGQ